LNSTIRAALASQYAQTSGDLETLKSSGRRCNARWTGSTAGSPDQDGFVGISVTAKGLVNQGWKDSHDAIFHADDGRRAGRLRSPRCKAMSMRPRPLRRSAPSSSGLRIARGLREQADRLADRFEQSFWCEELGSYAMALDGEKSPVACAAQMPAKSCSAGSRGSIRAKRVARG
jgi:glycogen debranching enzyme